MPFTIRPLMCALHVAASWLLALRSRAPRSWLLSVHASPVDTGTSMWGGASHALSAPSVAFAPPTHSDSSSSWLALPDAAMPSWATAPTVYVIRQAQFHTRVRLASRFRSARNSFAYSSHGAAAALRASARTTSVITMGTRSTAAS